MITSTKEMEQNEMKTFTSIKKSYHGHSVITIIEADLKREGLYKMGEIHVGRFDKPRKFSLAYGKKNQAKIIAAAKDMIEVA
jgi:predicted ATPase